MPNDVKLTDISEDGDGHITFYLYLRVDNGILRAEHILQAVQVRDCRLLHMYKDIN